ncbi:transcriptional repressor [Heliobacterium gestii]|uniref:Transcriptional repressor n=1 Tax=Heliomicrobium gestii TaxID=2699 RepID=A0A845LBV2_HELGE|nr:Fur family transcriptional regulator [Heliomicrobium gestii]MBM7868021.1 Fe2+ or Zn2+ uptake regulation protein [Heliomicrobium gestii]MZP44287.1 transcriptional repressor [Heliomicrobium gestii]
MTSDERIQRQAEDVLELLKVKGYKFTPQRRAVIGALIEANRPLSVKEMVDRLRESYPDMSADTVYRNLKVLCDLGVVSLISQQGKEGARYELDGRPHHHHLVCVTCGKSVCLPYCPMQERAEEMARREDFHVLGHTFEIFGYCRDCQREESSS